MAFLFCLTNPGLEKALKAEMSLRFPQWRIAFSAPEFLTFKGEGPWPVPHLARLWGECLGKEHAEGSCLDLGAAGIWKVKIHTPDPHWSHPQHVSGLVLPQEAPSRAWLKLEEAISLFHLPLKSGESALEVGAAPGGAVYALLRRGLHVRAVDPAEMDPRLKSYPHFRHLKKPFQELAPAEIQGVDWWLSDLNLAPGTVLSHLGRLLRECPKPKGLILTLKIGKPQITTELIEHERRVRSWGYQTHMRLLPSSHQEVLLLALA